MKTSLLFSLFLLIHSFLFAADEIPVANTFHVKLLNYNDPKAALLNKKFELGVALPDEEIIRINNFVLKNDAAVDQKINPFLEWEMDVEAVFTHASGLTEKVDGFYYRDYTRNTRTNDWSDKVNPFPFRVRFCPTAIGDWTYTISVKVKGQPKYSTKPESFQVIESNAHGFTTVHPNKKNLSLDGKIFMPVGQVLLAPVNGVDSYTVKANETNKAARLDDWMAYHQDIKDYHSKGGNFIRTVQTAWSSLIEFEEKGNYYNRLHYAWEQDKLLEYCEENGMMMNFNFMFQEPIMSYGQYYTAVWDFAHYEIQNDGTYKDNVNDSYPAYCYYDKQGKEPHEMFLNEEDIRYHQQRMRYYISRYGYSTSIMVFELLSEPFHLDQFYPKESFEMKNNEHGKIVREALLNYNRRMSGYIKDSMGHHSHLIGVHAFDNTIYWQDEEAKKILDESCMLPTIDVVGFSTYKNEPSRLIITKHIKGTNVDEDENSFYKKMNDFWSAYGKPVMHFEQGSTADGPLSPNVASGFIPHQIDMKTVGFTGCAGYFAWEGYVHDEKNDTRIAWPSTVLAEKWLNSDTMRSVLGGSNGQWVQGRQSERHSRSVSAKTKETQYYISGDQKNAVGYVSNRTVNCYTMALTPENQSKMQNPGPSYNQLQDIAWTGGTRYLYVSSLSPKKSYKVTWYDGTTGQIISSDVARTSRKGEFRLEFPTLTVTPGNPFRPIIWYTLTQVSE